MTASNDDFLFPPKFGRGADARKLEREKSLRKTNPALREAWERYQVILKLIMEEK